MGRGCASTWETALMTAGSPIGCSALAGISCSLPPSRITNWRGAWCGWGKLAAGNLARLPASLASSVWQKMLSPWRKGSGSSCLARCWNGCRWEMSRCWRFWRICSIALFCSCGWSGCGIMGKGYWLRMWRSGIWRGAWRGWGKLPVGSWVRWRGIWEAGCWQRCRWKMRFGRLLRRCLLGMG